MIPKIIHTIWPGNDPFRQKFHAWRASWMKYNPEYSMMFWNLSNLPYDLMTPLGAKLAKSNLCYVSKADLIRYEILYLYGGIYVDADMECIKAIGPLVKGSFFAGKSYPPDGIINAIIGIIPKHPVFKEIIQVVAESFSKEWEAANDPKRLYCEPAGSMHKIAGNYLSKINDAYIYPTATFYPFWCLDKREKRAQADLSKSYTIHWWNGIEKNGWGHVDYSKNRTPSLA